MPGNLVYTNDCHLRIINFNSAVRVGCEDDRVEGAYGTPGWMAPEILKQDAFSPIRADRWSCGKALLYFLEERRTEGGELLRFANEMMNDNPLHQPSLADWLEGVDVMTTRKTRSQ